MLTAQINSCIAPRSTIALYSLFVEPAKLILQKWRLGQCRVDLRRDINRRVVEVDRRRNLFAAKHRPEKQSDQYRVAATVHASPPGVISYSNDNASRCSRRCSRSGRRGSRRQRPNSKRG